MHFLRGAIDTCKVSQGILGTYLLKNLQTNTQRFGNIPLACPHKKGSYYLYNIPRINETNFPALFPHHRGQWEATFSFKARVMKSLKLTQLFHYKIQGVSFAWTWKMIKINFHLFLFLNFSFFHNFSNFWNNFLMKINNILRHHLRIFDRILCLNTTAQLSARLTVTSMLKLWMLLIIVVVIVNLNRLLYVRKIR